MLAYSKSATATNAHKPARPAVWMAKARPVKAWQCGEEPALHDMLADETMQRLMARDRVDPDALLALVRSMRERLAEAG